MGIPMFYRWVRMNCASVSMDAIEEEEYGDTSAPNPNGVEFDNLYLDMNGIIHPCFHPDGMLAFESHEEVFAAIYEYIDRIFSIIRPRKLLFIAIDGVAPRAKLNHQRSRRFKAAKAAAENAASVEGNKYNPQLMQKMDSNIITPGTEFMVLLSSALKYYIHMKMNQSTTTDGGWRKIKVIFSDASVPGEGEHKIMSYIRLQKNLPGYDPNTRHCLYGLDADLILLALASHERYCTVLRELGTKSRRKDLKRYLRTVKDASEQMEAVRKNLEEIIQNQIFTFVNIKVLRKCIVKAMTCKNSSVNLDEKRLIDDFVLMCLFVGNDFLPRLPSLEVSKRAITQLMKIYSKEFSQIGGYLTNSFEVNLERLERLIKAIGSLETENSKTTGKKTKKPLWHKTEKSLKQQEREKNARPGGSNSAECETSFISEDQIDENDSSKIQVKVDKVRIGEEGWKKRYYAEKFESKTEDDCEQIRKHAVSKYIEGVCWIMRYYYEGLCSWQWFYPYYYAPPASDFNGISQLEINFTLGEPFKPFEQLMAVMPAASAHAVPACYRKLMTDSSSPISDFYPTDYEVDMSETDVKWMGICKIPFIDESRLLSEISNLESSLTCEEMQRNVFGMDFLYLHITHPLAQNIFSFCQKMDNYPKLLPTNLEINPNYSGGMNGFVCLHDKVTLQSIICSPIPWLHPIQENQVISLLYKYPEFQPHNSRPPSEVILPQMVVTGQELSEKESVGHDKRGWKKYGGNTVRKSMRETSISNNQNKEQLSNHVIADGTGGKKIVETKQEVKSRKRERSPINGQQQKVKDLRNVKVPRLWRE